MLVDAENVIIGALAQVVFLYGGFELICYIKRRRRTQLGSNVDQSQTAKLNGNDEWSE